MERGAENPISTSPNDNLLSDIDLDSIVNEVTGGDVRNLDHFNDSVLSRIPEGDVPAVPEEFNPVVAQSRVSPSINLDGQSKNTDLHSERMNTYNKAAEMGRNEYAPIYVVYVDTNTQVPVNTLPAEQTLDMEITPQNSKLSSFDTAPCSTLTTEGLSRGETAKRKMYEFEAFSDPVLEKKRRNAINARNHRIRTKERIQTLEQQVEMVTNERDEMAKKNDIIQKKREEESNILRGEIKELRESNEALKRKLHQAIQELQSTKHPKYPEM
ncbi:hypothetical protein SK128_020542 [Halocaridina rubra]|uniref:BZIP domain-containing protein n=1 Tax=Halocaridina rubra TaxID=373956 RepID=A0AAN8XMW2_HALRR